MRDAPPLDLDALRLFLANRPSDPQAVDLLRSLDENGAEARAAHWLRNHPRSALAVAWRSVRGCASPDEVPACDRPLPPDFPAMAVIGGGNLGVTSAAYATARGGRASLYIRASARGREKLATLEENENTLLLTPCDGEPRSVRLEQTSPQMASVVRGRPLVVVTVPAFGHPEVARLLAPHLEPGATVVLHPGQTFGAFSFFEDLKTAGADPEVLSTVAIVELGISIFTTRSSVRNAEYTALKRHIMASCFPAEQTRKRVAPLQTLYPTTDFTILEDSLAMSFHPIATGPHTLITLSHLSDIAAGRTYAYYLEGVDALNIKLMKRFDDERCAIARAWGYEPYDLKTCMQRMYGMDNDSLQELYNDNPAYIGYSSPTELETRYFTEEVPTGVKPLLELADMAGVQAPMIRAVETFVDTLFADTEYDFDATARSLHRMGLGGLSPAELQGYARTGVLPQGSS